MEGNHTSIVRVALYARVSSEQQAQQSTIGSQLEALKDRIRTDALALDDELCFIDDGYSGSTLLRPALERLRDVAWAGGFQRLYVHSPDRLARKYAWQVLLVEELQRYGVELIFLNRTIGVSPEEDLLLQMQGMIAEYERAKIMERSRRGKRHAALRGDVSVLGTAPYGYRFIGKHAGGGDAHYQVVLEEARVVHQIFEWVAHERLSFNAVCKRLKLQGTPSPKGLPRWHREVIGKLLRNPAYKGTAIFGRSRVGERRARLRPPRGKPEQPRHATSRYPGRPEDQTPIPVPALVSDELFMAVADQLTEKKQRQQRCVSDCPGYLLQGLMECGCCGRAYYGKGMTRFQQTRSEGKTFYPYYRCPGSDSVRHGGTKACHNKPLRLDRLDGAIWADICAVLQNPKDLRDEFERRLQGVPEADANLQQCQKQIAQAQRSISRLIDAYETGLLEKSEFEPRVRRAKERLKRLTGPSGSGKSAALARFVRDYQHQQPQTLVIPHFIGACPRSTNLRDMLRRFCQVFKAHFGFAEEVPEEVAKLSVTFRELVSKVPTNARVLLVIDALNQLDEGDRARDLYWLPTAFPAQVKVILSCITDSGKTEPVLEAFRWRKHCPVQLAALSAAEQREIIRQVPSLSAKTLDEDQVRLLLSNPATANPLFLLVALEELRGFASYERLNERIAAFPRERDTVTAIFTQVIERLAEEFNQNLVETVLTLLASARRGLSERELQELVAGLDGADDLFPVLRQLRPYLLSRAGLIDFYHRNLFKAVRERYLSSEVQRLAHVRLAEYFNAQDYWLESLEEQQRRAKTPPPTPRPANGRKVDELPWQLLQAADWQKSEQLLTDLAFLEAKAEAGIVFDLAADFSAVIAGMPAHRPLLRVLRLLAEALRRDIHFIARHPTTLFQCLWNLCWWYDSPEAAQHYEEGTAPGQDGAVLLHQMLETWRAKKEQSTPGFIWLRSLRPPPVHLGAGLQRVFKGHESLVMSVAYSPDGRLIASGGADGTVQIGDAATGANLLCLKGHVVGKDDLSGGAIIVASVAFSPEGSCLASGGWDGTVRVWDTHTGVELLRLQAHEREVFSVAFSPDGHWLASGSRDQTVRVWDAATGEPLLCLQGHKDPVWSVAFSPDGRLASGSGDSTIRVWDASTGTELLCLHGHESWVLSVAFSPDGRYLASGSHDCTVRVWDAATGAKLLCHQGHENMVRSVTFSPDGRRVGSGSRDQTVRVWDPVTGTELVCLHGHAQEVESVAFSPDGRHLASGARDGTVRVWDAAGGAALLHLHGHHPKPGLPEPVGIVAFTPDGRHLVSFSSDGFEDSGRLWDATTGKRLSWTQDTLDVASAALGNINNPTHAFLMRWEVGVVGYASRHVVAWFPAALFPLAEHPGGRTWAGAVSSENHVFLFTLEGNPPLLHGLPPDSLTP